MRFIHISDLHLGKRLKEYSLIEDQSYILKKILNIIVEEKADGVIIAGDIYDKSVPSAEAVQLFDSFLTGISGQGVKAFVISGNHDSPERISFGSKLMEESGIYIAPVFDGKINPVTMKDEHGEILIYMLPFIKPSSVRGFFEEEIESYTDAVRLSLPEIDVSKRNILVTHQFVTGATRSESEEISVGGTDNVDSYVFDGFDYVALGHIHSAQNCGSEKIRYCGTPLKYSFSESKDEKSVTVIDFFEKGKTEMKTVPLIPLRDMHEIKGSYSELMAKSFYENTTYQYDYMHITLTDEEDIPDAVMKLRTVYRNLMSIGYDNTRTRKNVNIEIGADAEQKTPMEIFRDFYFLQNNKEMTSDQGEYVGALIKEIWEDEQ